MSPWFPRVLCVSLMMLGLTAAGAGIATAAPIYVNETNNGSEADFVILSPASMTVTANTSTSTITGEVFESLLTPAAGAHASILADVGYGTLGSDPRSDSSWQWFAAVYGTQVGNDDQYKGTFVAPGVNGQYSYTFRFSVDGGATYTVADTNGAGSNSGLDFSTSALGTLTVTGGLDPTVATAPEPASLLLLGSGLALVGRRVRRQRRRAA